MKKRIILITIAALALIYMLGPTPDTPVYATALPQLPENIVDVESLVLTTENRPDIKPDNNARIEWADDSTKTKTPYVLLYLHGFTASRIEGDPTYGNYAKRYGMNVYAARLATQGLDTLDQMIDYRPERIWESALRALAIAQKLGDKVIIMSTSTGGTLALKLAADFPEIVTGLINLSPNIRPLNPEAVLLTKPWGLQIARLVMGGNFRELHPKDSLYQKYWYVKYRLEAVVYLQKLVETTMNEETFSRVTCPVLNVFYYKDEDQKDDVVSVDRIRWMHKSLATPEAQKRAVEIPNAATHVIGCALYSQALPEVETAVFDFSETVLQLKPRTLAR